MIEIPGYRIVRPLGRGGMASVYLAIQESVDREVALKIMSPQLLADPNFGERFLREARIAAKLRHRHVVGVHDVGKAGDLHYIAMEYLTGGAILHKDGQPRDVAFALRVTREIATALGYAHAKGFIHRDVKPDNVLLRDDGSSALTDFGIARASDSATRMTRTGAVIGTPHYMSPEQARGKVVDGRADLYSLGVVLYELLVGRVPFTAEDSLAVGIMHITEPVPPLPDSLSALQPMLEVMLAKRPDDRYQTGDEMAGAIREYELAIARGELPSLMTPTDEQRDHILATVPAIARTPPPPQATPQPPTRAMPSVGGANSAGERVIRSEPRLGDIGELDDDEPRRRRAARQEDDRRRGWLKPALVVLVLAAIGVGLWWRQDDLRRLVPNTELNTLLAEGDQALADGRLVGTNGLSARELYLAVLKLDADNTQARAGLREVGNRLVAQARAALDGGDPVRARNLASQAREVLQGGEALDALDADIRTRESRSVELNTLLEQALAAQQAGKLTGGEDSAAALFQRALAADATNGIALRGLDDIVATLGTRAKEAAAAGRLDEAEAQILEIEKVRPSDASVPGLRAAVADAKAAGTKALETLLAQGDAQLRAGKLTAPANDNALASYDAVLAQDPQNARARAGRARIGASLLPRADAALDAGDLAAAGRLLAQAQSLGAPAGDVRAVRTKLAELKEKQEIAAEQAATITPEEQQKIDDYLDDADRALAGGDLIEPPGANAYDLYRAALALDRRNERAVVGLTAIPGKARELFAQEISDKRPNAARRNYDAFSSTSKDTAAKKAMAGELARAYVQQAERQVAAQQLQAAAKSLATARELAPAEPTIATVQAQLTAAGG
ncbi:MAG TPA: protein kinase [Xanthomonadales bacterium]|nr:protein kinase [Xanthomonadales bacterium]